MDQYLRGTPRIHLIDPLPADSSGLWEEAHALGKPVLVLCQETERPETIFTGKGDFLKILPKTPAS